jgi:hypothetical protein
MVLQVYSDGVDFEASTGYHALVTQLFTCAILLMQAARTESEPGFTSRLRGMYRYIAELCSPNGVLPHVGDCDDGRIELLTEDLRQMLDVPTEERTALGVADLLGIGAALFGTVDGTFDDATWYFPPDRRSNASGSLRQPQKPPKPVIFPKGGVGVLRRVETEVVFLAIPNGIHGDGSHTHNDKLSLILRIRGQEPQPTTPLLSMEKNRIRSLLAGSACFR